MVNTTIKRNIYLEVILNLDSKRIRIEYDENDEFTVWFVLLGIMGLCYFLSRFLCDLIENPKLRRKAMNVLVGLSDEKKKKSQIFLTLLSICPQTYTAINTHIIPYVIIKNKKLI